MRSFAFLSLAVLSLSAWSPAQEGSIAFKVGTIHTHDFANGPVLKNATLVVHDGRVQTVAVDAEVPFDVLLEEHPEAVIFPGFLEAHTSSGVDRPNENVPVAPFLNIKDSLDPSSFYFEDELRKGVVGMGVIPGNSTIFGGQGRVVSPFGRTVEQMTLAPDMGMKIVFGGRFRWSRSAQIAQIREEIAKLNARLRLLGQRLADQAAADADKERAGEEVEPRKEFDGDDVDISPGFVKFGEDFPGKDMIAAEDLDDTQRYLVHILNGDMRLWLYAPVAADVAAAHQWSKEHDLLEKVVFVVTPAAWKAKDILKTAHRPVFLTPNFAQNLFHIERDPVTYKEVRTFVPKVFTEAGIEFAIGSLAGRMGPDRLAYQVSLCMREGMSRTQAMKTVTTVPARMWGLEDRVGTLKTGADGTFVVLDGDPLKIGTKVLQVWVRGAKVYDRTTDLRLQRLLEGGN